MRAQDLAERGALDARDEQTQQIGRISVVKRCAGLIEQRQLRKLRNPYIRREFAVDGATERVCVGAADRAPFAIRVREPGAMSEQIVKRDGPMARRGFCQIPRCRAQHPQLCELGRPTNDRMVERDLPFFHEHERGRTGDGLTHRSNAK